MPGLTALHEAYRHCIRPVHWLSCRSGCFSTLFTAFKLTSQKTFWNQLGLAQLTDLLKKRVAAHVGLKSCCDWANRLGNRLLGKRVSLGKIYVMYGEQEKKQQLPSTGAQAAHRMSGPHASKFKHHAIEMH